MFLFIYTLIACAEKTQPRLIVQLVIDQLRGDLINRHHKQFGTDGFNYLLKHKPSIFIMPIILMQIPPHAQGMQQLQQGAILIYMELWIMIGLIEIQKH